jgi:hypothetical protein
VNKLLNGTCEVPSTVSLDSGISAASILSVDGREITSVFGIWPFWLKSRTILMSFCVICLKVQKGSYRRVISQNQYITKSMVTT